MMNYQSFPIWASSLISFSSAVPVPPLLVLAENWSLSPVPPKKKVPCLDPQAPDIFCVTEFPSIRKPAQNLNELKLTYQLKPKMP